MMTILSSEQNFALGYLWWWKLLLLLVVLVLHLESESVLLVMSQEDLGPQLG